MNDTSTGRPELDAVSLSRGLQEVKDLLVALY